MEIQELDTGKRSGLDDKIDEFLKGIEDGDEKNLDDGPGFYDEPDYEQFGVDNQDDNDKYRDGDEHESGERQVTGHIKV